MENVKRYNTLYSGCISEPWLDVVKQLDKELGLNPVYFIGWKSDNSSKIVEEYPNCYYQTIENAWRGLGFPNIDYKFEFNEETIKNISFEKNLALKMMDRLDLGRGSFTFLNRELFFNYLLKHWFNIVEYYNIDLIITPSVPHRVFDYVLYIVAKIKNIEIVMFQMSSFSDSSFIINEIDNTPTYLKEYIQSADVSNISLRKDIIDKLDTVRKDYTLAVPDYITKQKEQVDKLTFTNNMIARIKNLVHNPLSHFEKDASYYIMQNDDLPYTKKSLVFHRKINRYKNAFYQKKLKKQYEQLAIEPDLNEKYVFVALHYQPEETSIPTGGSFGDQTLIIELLNKFLDDDYKIYIKEHKSQFYPDQEGAMGRNINYYTHIAKISKRIHFINIDSDPFKLIEKATCTVSVSGTIGWESAVRGTPSLVFGRTWYEDMPNVFKIKSLNDLKNRWSSILKAKNNISDKEIEDYHKKLQKFFIDAPHYKFFQGKVKRSAEENCLNITNGIKNHLQQINFL